MLDPRDPLGLEVAADAMRRLSDNMRELLAFSLFTAVMAALAILLMMFH
ncbi:MAG TPA: hypothetical protein VIA80_01590 [Hyphomonadaceae bacterium]|jgi:hypothetical protein